MTIKVKATQRGFYGGRLYSAGDEFSVAAKGDIGSWMSPVVEELKAPKPHKGGGKRDEPQVTHSAEADDLA